MSPGKKTHLYTIWNPKHCPSTIDEHCLVLGEKGFVKWLIFYDKKAEREYRNILSDSDIDKINKQAEKSETILFIQCLNIFHEKIYAGKIVGIEKQIKAGLKDDPYIPSYYYETISIGLRAHYFIKLSMLEPTDLEEILNLKPSKGFRSERFNFPFPCKVYQKETREILNLIVGRKFKQVVLARESIKDKTTTRLIVKDPQSFNYETPLTLGSKEFELIKLFENRSQMVIGKMAKEYKKIYQDKSGIVRLIKSVNGRYIIKTDNLIIKTDL
jgi:hypothetical protein